MKPIQLTAAATHHPMIVDADRILWAAQDSRQIETRVMIDDHRGGYVVVKESPAEIACAILGIATGPKPFGEPFVCTGKPLDPLPEIAPLKVPLEPGDVF